MATSEEPSDHGAKHTLLVDVASLLREYAGAVATLGRDSEDIGRIIKHKGLHQGQGLSQAIFVLTTEALVGRRFDEIGRCRRYDGDRHVRGDV